MADYDIPQSTSFEIQRLAITTDYGVIDVSAMYVEINLFDSVLQPCMSGNILIQDAVGLANKLAFDGSEFITISISKSGFFLPYNKTFHIYKMSHRKATNLNMETYILHFSSEEFVYSEQQRVQQHFFEKHSDVVGNILSNYLSVPDNRIHVEESRGVRQSVLPKMKPLEAITWCAKRALDENYRPNFLFFENLQGFFFASLSSIMKNGAIATIKNSVTNLGQDSTSNDFLSAKKLEVVSQYDYIDNTRAGLYAGTFIGFDPMTRTYKKIQMDLNSNLGKSELANDYKNKSNYRNPGAVINTKMFDSKIEVFPFSMEREKTPWLLYNDPVNTLSEDSPEKWLFQRNAILKNMTSRVVRVAISGNFALTSGYNINMLVPVRAQKADNDPDENLDMSLSGRYLIIASRHIIRYDKHETILELATDSTNQESKAPETNVSITDTSNTTADDYNATIPNGTGTE